MKSRRRVNLDVRRFRHTAQWEATLAHQELGSATRGSRDRMANGRGSLECCYCIHYNGYWSGYDAVHEAGYCLHHDAVLPSTVRTQLNRICRDFEPNDAYWAHHPEHELDGIAQRMNPARQFSWFGTELRSGILYVFDYPAANAVREYKSLDPETDSTPP